MKDLITDTANAYRLDPILVAAVILQESGGDQYAVRYEPLFFDRYVSGKTQYSLQGYVPKRCSLATELSLRATSFGLMQVMGQVARENGFCGEFLTELLNPQVNLTVGCNALAKYVERKQGSLRQALLRYNGGGNIKYPDEVFARMVKAKEKWDL